VSAWSTCFPESVVVPDGQLSRVDMVIDAPVEDLIPSCYGSVVGECTERIG
jgi:hypothetical protein